MRVVLFLSLVGGCHEQNFVSDTTEESTQAVTSIDVREKTPKPTITSEPLSSSSKTYFQLSPQLFTINPHGEDRNETMGFIKSVTITMESLITQSSEAKTSASRVLHSQSFTQTGRDGTPRQVDNFMRQRDKGLLDLLLVVDDSRSMSQVHTSMVNNLNGLLSQIDNSNWKINIVDVDTNQLCEHTIIDSNNKQLYGQTLQSLINSPNFNERAIVKARIALGLDRRCNYRWMRPSSTLAMVIITNEDHQCANSGAVDNRGNDSNSFLCGHEVRDFINEFRGLRPSNTRLYGIFNTEIDCRCGRACKLCFDSGVTNYGNSRCPENNPCYSRGDNNLIYSHNYLAPGIHAYDLVRHLSSGAVPDWCSSSCNAPTPSNYGDILSSISRNINEILQYQFTLSYTPDSASEVEVLVNNSRVTTGYQLTGNILTFTSDPGGDDISVSYLPTGGSNPIPYVNTLHVSDSNADLTTATVNIGGRPLTRGRDYSVSGQTITLVGDMRTVFPTSATVYYYQQQTKQRIFTFAAGKEVVNGSVRVAGASGNSFSVGRNPNRVIFNSGHEPNYGTNFSIGYRYYSGNKLSYPTNVRWNVEQVECDSSVSCQYSNNNIVITNGFRRGGTFTATIHPANDNNVQEQSNSTDLPTTYVPGSLCLARELRHCQQDDNGLARQACDGSLCCSETQLVIDNNNDKIMLTTDNADANGCAILGSLDTNIDQLRLNYQTYDPKQQFTVDKSLLTEFFGQYQEERWEVFVADEKKTEATDYTINQSEGTIDFKGQYPVDSKVRVVIYLE